MCFNLSSLLCGIKSTEIETTDFLFNVINKQIYEFHISEIACRCYNIGDTIMFNVMFQDNSMRLCKGEIIKKCRNTSNIYLLSDALPMENIRKINIISSI